MDADTITTMATRASWVRSSGTTNDDGGVLVGRHDELGVLRGHAEAVQQGHGRIVVICGEGGIGKTRLIAEALELPAAVPWHVLWGTAEELQQQRPFGVVCDALAHTRSFAQRSLEADLVRAARSPDDRGPGLESRIAQEFTQIVDQETTGQPVVVVFDNLQWADDSSLLAVKGIARLTLSRPVLLLCALRAYPRKQSLLALLASLEYLGAERLDLYGLEPLEAGRLAGALAGRPVDGQFLDAINAVGGNPFFISEVVKLLGAESALAFSQSSSGGTRWVPTGLTKTVLDGLRSLPHETLETLQAAAIVGQRFSITELGLIMPSRVADVVAALNPALEAGVIACDDNDLAFRHDLIREAIYADLPPHFGPRSIASLPRSSLSAPLPSKKLPRI
jgi:predicted ATPase